MNCFSGSLNHLIPQDTWRHPPGFSSSFLSTHRLFCFPPSPNPQNAHMSAAVCTCMYVYRRAQMYTMFSCMFKSTCACMLNSHRGQVRIDFAMKCVVFLLNHRKLNCIQIFALWGNQSSNSLGTEWGNEAFHFRQDKSSNHVTGNHSTFGPEEPATLETPLPSTGGQINAGFHTQSCPEPEYPI